MRGPVTGGAPGPSGVGEWRVIWFFRLLLLGFLVFGVVLAWRGWQLRRLSPALLRTWTETTGTVVGVLRRNDLDDSPVTRPRYFHELEYAGPSGDRHRVWTEVGHHHELARGTVLPLRYDPEDSSRATTLSPDEGGGTTPGWGLVAAGAVFTLIGGYGTVLIWL